MILLQWKGTLRFGVWVRGSLWTQRVTLAIWAAFGWLIGLGLWLLGDLPLAVAVMVGLWLLPVLIVVLSVAQLLRRLRRIHGSKLLEQWYAITPDALDVSLGRDRASIPLDDLSVSDHGPDWVAARRRGMGRRKLVLYVDDDVLVPRVVALLNGRATPV